MGLCFYKMSSPPGVKIGPQGSEHSHISSPPGVNTHFSLEEAGAKRRYYPPGANFSTRANFTPVIKFSPLGVWLKLVSGSYLKKLKLSIEKNLYLHLFLGNNKRRTLAFVINTFPWNNYSTPKIELRPCGVVYICTYVVVSSPPVELRAVDRILSWYM
jgi:hypothetical protein